MYLSDWLTEENRPYMLKQTHIILSDILKWLFLQHCCFTISDVCEVKLEIPSLILTCTTEKHVVQDSIMLLIFFLWWHLCWNAYLESFVPSCWAIKLKRIMDWKHCKLTSVGLSSQKLFIAWSHWHPTTQHWGFRLRWLISSEKRICTLILTNIWLQFTRLLFSTK